MQRTGESFRDSWRRRFERYGRDGTDDAQIAGWTATGLDQRLRFFRHCWSPSAAGGLWLDAGCGAGTYSRLLAQHGLGVVGYDYSEPSLCRARARGYEGIAWVLGDVTRLPFRAAAFDGVLCLGVTQAMPISAEIVREAAAVLRPGGEFWIDGLNPWALPHLLRSIVRRLRRQPPHLRYESPWALRTLLHAHGFEQVRLHWMPVVPGRWLWVARTLDTRAARRLLRVLGPLCAPLSHSFLVRGVQSRASK